MCPKIQNTFILQTVIFFFTLKFEKMKMEIQKTCLEFYGDTVVIVFRKILRFLVILVKLRVLRKQTKHVCVNHIHHIL